MVVKLPLMEVVVLASGTMAAQPVVVTASMEEALVNTAVAVTPMELAKVVMEVMEAAAVDSVVLVSTVAKKGKLSLIVPGYLSTDISKTQQDKLP